jgi:vacuolar-type H+-ATPase catalytic subunit A/Vma1
MINSVYKLYPQVVRTVGDVAYDKDENIVEYDLALVQAEEALEAKRQEARAYLASTDYMMTADYDKDTTEVKALRAEARAVIRGVK